MAGFSRQQLEVAQRALAVADRLGSSPRERKALILAGLTESDLRQLQGGDRDSTGFLQQRPSQGWGPVGESVERDAEQFLRAAHRANTGRGSAGQLAQRVQRSAFPDRYDQRGAEGVQLLRRFGAGGGAAGDGGALLGASAGGGQAAGVPQGSEGLVALLGALSERPQPRSSAGVQAPAFSAAAPMPQGAQLPVSGGGPAPKPDVNALLEAVRTVGGDVPQAPVDPASGQAVLGGADGGARGQVTLSPGADRAGVPTSRSILHVAEMVAARAGKPLQIGTGSAHSRLTASGNVSDHWAGRGVDIPAAGKQLTALGADALEALGIDRRKAAAMARKGGIYNVPYGRHRRVQVIVNAPDHYDHLHLGVSPR